MSPSSSLFVKLNPHDPSGGISEDDLWGSEVELKNLFFVCYFWGCSNANREQGWESHPLSFPSDQNDDSQHDYLDDKDPKEKTQMTDFFGRFYFLISTGTLRTLTVFIYIQDEVGQSWAYGICCIFMILAIIVFFSESKRHKYKKSIAAQSCPHSSGYCVCHQEIKAQVSVQHRIYTCMKISSLRIKNPSHYLVYVTKITPKYIDCCTVDCSITLSVC